MDYTQWVSLRHEQVRFLFCAISLVAEDLNTPSSLEVRSEKVPLNEITTMVVDLF